MTGCPVGEALAGARERGVADARLPVVDSSSSHRLTSGGNQVVAEDFTEGLRGALRERLRSITRRICRLERIGLRKLEDARDVELCPDPIRGLARSGGNISGGVIGAACICLPAGTAGAGPPFGLDFAGGLAGDRSLGFPTSHCPRPGDVTRACARTGVAVA